MAPPNADGAIREGGTMTAWIWLYDQGSDSPYAAEISHRFEVRTVAHARELAALLSPDAPELAASVVVECEYTTCGRRLMISEEHAPTVDAARETAYDPRAFHGGWYRALYRGRQADICQWHY